jgi:hypothetical protein
MIMTASKFLRTVALGAAFALTTFAADAMPIAPLVPHSSDDVIQVRGLCGLGWHRGPWGECRRNGVVYAYGPYPRCWWRYTPWGPVQECRW